MSDTVRIVRLSTRIAPDGSWVAGSDAEVTPADAAVLIAKGQARLAPGETLTARAIETASYGGGEIPAGEPVKRITRERGAA